MPLTVVPSLFGYRGPACPLPTVRYRRPVSAADCSVPETRVRCRLFGYRRPMSAADCSVLETRVRSRLFGTGDPCPLPTVRYRDPPVRCRLFGTGDPPVRCRLFGTGTRLSAADCSVPGPASPLPTVRYRDPPVRCRLFGTGDPCPLPTVRGLHRCRWHGTLFLVQCQRLERSAHNVLMRTGVLHNPRDCRLALSGNTPLKAEHLAQRSTRTGTSTVTGQWDRAVLCMGWAVGTSSG